MRGTGDDFPTMSKQFNCDTVVSRRTLRSLPLLTAVAAVGTGDELLWPLVAVLLLGPQTEAADGDGLRHRLAGGRTGGRGKKREERQLRLSVSFNSIIVQMSTTKCPCVSRHSGRLCVCVLTSQEQPGSHKAARKQQL